MENAVLQSRLEGFRTDRLYGWLARPLPWIVLLVVGLVARLCQYLWNPSYWYDEAFLTVGIYQFSFLKLIGPLPGRNIVPPIFLWLVRGCYETFGPAEWSLRLPAIIAGIAGLLLMISLARRWLGTPGWFWVAGLCALSIHCINHSVEVRSYTSDFLMTVFVLFLAHGYLNATAPAQRSRWRRWLLVAAALGPWLSFTSAFVLGAASVAFFVHYLHQRCRERLAFWLGFNALLLSTGFLVWYIQARHLYYPGLKDEWAHGWGGFPLDYSFGPLFRWTMGAAVLVGHYASTGLGIPLLLLGLAGLVRCWQRCKAEALLLTVPVVLTYMAALVGKYPFADRTIFFLAPCSWLLAAEGLLFLIPYFKGRSAVAVPLMVLGLLIPGFCHTLQRCFHVMPRMEYREALLFVHDRCGEQDAVWDWCSDLQSTYFDHVFSWPTKPPAHLPHDGREAAQLVLTHPLWVVGPLDTVTEMIQPLRSLPVRQTLCQEFLGVKVVRLDSVRAD